MYRSLFLSLAATLFLIVGCSDDSPTNNGNNSDVPTEFGFTVKINGATWKADSAIYRTPSLPPYTKEIVAWIGEETRGEKVTISLINTTPGTYPVTIDTNTATIQFIADLDPGTAFNSDSAPATEGSVTIVEATDQYISGTFNFKGKGVFSSPSATYEGTSGAFKVKAE